MKKFPPTVFFFLALVASVSTSAQVGNGSRENRIRPSDSTETTADAAGVETVAEGQKHYSSGITLYNSGQTEEAIQSFKQAHKSMPRDPQALYMLGMAYLKSKAYKDAADSFKRAVSFKSDWPEAHFALGMTSYVVGRKSQSLEAYKRLVNLNSPLAPKLYRSIKGEAAATNLSTVLGEKEPLKNAEGVPTGLVQNLPATPVVASTLTPTGNETSLTRVTSTVPPSSPGLSDALTAPDDSKLTSIYRVSVGDILDIRLLNSASSRSTLYTVLAGGLIDFPMAGGSITVMDLTTDEIQSRIASELKRRAVEEGARVSVGVRQYASHHVVITGLVNSPGTKFLRREAVPLYVILAEAQTRLDAGRVSVIRSGTNEGKVLDIASPDSLNFLIRPGDLISVTGKPQEFYYIAGRINYSGEKIFQPGITLLQAILAAGGLSRQSDGKIELSRAGADGRLTTIKLKIKEIKSGRIQDPKLQPGDRIEIVN